MATQDEERPRRVTVLLNHSIDAEAWRERHAEGRTLDATPYGYAYADRWFDVRWARSHRESALVRRVRIALAGRLGFDLVHAVRNRRLLFDADVVWTHTEAEHLAVALLRRLVPRYRRTHVLAQTIWLWDRWPALSRPRRRVYAWLLRGHTVELTHSPVNLETSRRAVPGRRVVLVPFGTQPLEAPSTPPRDDERWDVVAPGNDEHRDWATLARVAALRSDLRFWVASSSRSARVQSWSPNVRVERVADATAYARLVAGARACVVPLKENQHVSGMTTCLEACSVGTPLVVAGDGGLSTIIGPGPRFVRVGDAEALARAIDAVVELTPEQRAEAVPDTAARGLAQRDYVTRYALLTDMVCGDRDWDDGPSKLSPQHREHHPSQ